MFTFIFPSHLHSTLFVLLPDLLFFNEFLNYTFGIDFEGGNLTLALSAKLPLTTPLRHVRRGQSRSIVPSVKDIPGYILLRPQHSPCTLVAVEIADWPGIISLREGGLLDHGIIMLIEELFDLGIAKNIFTCTSVHASISAILSETVIPQGIFLTLCCGFVFGWLGLAPSRTATKIHF